MKKISFVIPCYNEEGNVGPMSEAVTNLFKNELSNYTYEVIFIDNCSTDRTRELLREICAKDKNIKAIFNTRNFGQANSPYYAFLHTTGDCTVNLCCDFQEPVEMIPQFVKEWENGYKTVVAIKKKSRESAFMFLCRKLYYSIFKKMSNIEQIEQFTGFGLYDKSVVETLKGIKEPMPFFKGLIAEYGYKMKKIEYEQQKRRSGRSKNNFFTLYDYAMLSFTSYTKVGLRIATFIGLFGAFASLITGLVYFVLKLLFWYEFSAGMAPLIIVFLVISSFQLIFIGILGEYVMNINSRVLDRPLVIVEEKLNFDE